MTTVLPRQFATKSATSATSVHPKAIPFASEDFRENLPNRYLSDDGTPVSWKEATRSYQNHRLGEEASAEANGYRGGLRARALKKNGAIHRADRKFRAEFDSPIIGLVTIVGNYSPTDPDYGPILDYEQTLSKGITQMTQTIRYRLRRYQSAEYALIEAGTGTNGVPHWHLIIWADESDPTEFRTDLEVIVTRAQEELPSDVQEFRPNTEEKPSDAVLIDQVANTELKTFPSDPDGEPAHPFARYVANQLPHLGSADPEKDIFDGMSEAEVQFGAIADASLTRGFRSSSGVPTISNI